MCAIKHTQLIEKHRVEFEVDSDLESRQLESVSYVKCPGFQLIMALIFMEIEVPPTHMSKCRSALEARYTVLHIHT